MRNEKGNFLNFLLVMLHAGEEKGDMRITKKARERKKEEKKDL